MAVTLRASILQDCRICDASIPRASLRQEQSHFRICCRRDLVSYSETGATHGPGCRGAAVFQRNHGLPKGVMLSHLNLVANIYQLVGPNAALLSNTDNILCCLPLYHIYGLNVILSPALLLGATLVVTPRFNVEQMGRIL